MDVETGSGCLLKEFMRGKAYPLRPEQWPDVVLKGMEILNRNNMVSLLYMDPGAAREMQQEFFFSC